MCPSIRISVVFPSGLVTALTGTIFDRIFIKIIPLVNIGNISDKFYHGRRSTFFTRVILLEILNVWKIAPLAPSRIQFLPDFYKSYTIGYFMISGNIRLIGNVLVSALKGVFLFI